MEKSFLVINHEDVNMEINKLNSELKNFVNDIIKDIKDEDSIMKNYAKDIFIDLNGGFSKSGKGYIKKIKSITSNYNSYNFKKKQGKELVKSYIDKVKLEKEFYNISSLNETLDILNDIETDLTSDFEFLLKADNNIFKKININKNFMSTNIIEGVYSSADDTEYTFEKINF